MKLTGIINAQEIRLFDAVTGLRADVHKVDFVRAMQDRYKFLEVPHTVGGFDLKSGLSFVEGKCGDFRIGRLVIHENGIFCESPLHTADIGMIVDDVVTWARDSFSIAVHETREVFPRAYQSNIEVQCEFDIGATLLAFSRIGERIGEALSGYGIKSRPFLLESVRLHCEADGSLFPTPPAFVFERREGKSYGERIYFSSAPLRTEDHLAVLDALEASLRG